MIYKRGFSTPILICVVKEDANYILKEVHEGICGNHIGPRTLAGKTLRQGNYWPTMLKDATELVRKCKACQEHARISHLPFKPLTPITRPCLFSNGGYTYWDPYPLEWANLNLSLWPWTILPNGLRPNP